MNGEGTLFQTFIYLLAAVVSVPVAKRLGLGSVLGYLLAGVAIGSPAAFRLTGHTVHLDNILHFSEYGVVMMLFLVGLELRPARLWELRGPVLGMGALQVLGTAAAVLLVALAAGVGWRIGAAAGLILAMSSTAIVLQSLAEKGLLKTPGGEACFSVLLFQDLSVIPILAVLPLLATGRASDPNTGDTGNAAASGIGTLPGWLQGVVTLGTVAAIVFGGRYALRPIFRHIAGTGLREVFTSMALLLVVGIALLMQTVGLSAALGTFLAGVVLADSEYRHQLEADIEPFKGLLLGLFFISVGAGINFSLVAEHPGQILGLVSGLLALKFLVLLVLGGAFKLRATDNLLFAFALAQGGEFAFVLITFCKQQHVLMDATADPLTAAVALSMAATPLLLVVNEKLVQPRFAPPAAANEREPDHIDEHADGGAILAGFGRFGHIVGRLLKANGVTTTVLENDADWVETLREFGMKTYYGDATRVDLLHSAGADRAKLFIIAIDDREKSLELVDTVRQEFPHLTILARAVDRIHAYELIRRGIPGEHVYRETLGSSLDLSVDALQLMGFQAAQAQRAAKIYRENDAASMRELAVIYDGDRQTYLSTARQHIQNLENVLKDDNTKRFQDAEGQGEGEEETPQTIERVKPPG